jgi:hypothetical protein
MQVQRCRDPSSGEFIASCNPAARRRVLGEQDEFDVATDGVYCLPFWEDSTRVFFCFELLDQDLKSLLCVTTEHEMLQCLYCSRPRLTCIVDQ